MQKAVGCGMLWHTRCCAAWDIWRWGMRDAPGYAVLGDAGCCGIHGTAGRGMLRGPRRRGMLRDVRCPGVQACRGMEEATGHALPPILFRSCRSGAGAAPPSLHTPPPPPLPKLRLLSTPQLVAGGMEWDDHATLRDTHHSCVGTRGHACACANTAGAAGAAAGTPPPPPPPKPQTPTLPPTLTAPGPPALRRADFHDGINEAAGAVTPGTRRGSGRVAMAVLPGRQSWGAGDRYGGVEPPPHTLPQHPRCTPRDARHSRVPIPLPTGTRGVN